MQRTIHRKCRGGHYPFTTIARLILTDDLIAWTTPFPAYHPPEYTSPSLKGKPYADPDLGAFTPKWNSLDGHVNRVSHEGGYEVVDGRPLNPRGRTGLCGRGVLGRWGPNHAADPVVTRWKRENGGGERVLDAVTKLPILQFCAIQRRDCGQWAIPGGMVDPGEHVTQTLRREFLEEALSALESDPEKLKRDQEIVEAFFSTGQEIYKGYVDDPRNTDNAWMETVAFNFHDESGDCVGKFDLKAGDDAKNIKWIDIGKDLDLYASHSELIHRVVELRGAHW